MYSVLTNNLSLKLGCKDIGIRKFKFVAKTQFRFTFFIMIKSQTLSYPLDIFVCVFYGMYDIYYNYISCYLLASIIYDIYYLHCGHNI